MGADPWWQRALALALSGLLASCSFAIKGAPASLSAEHEPECDTSAPNAQGADLLGGTIFGLVGGSLLINAIANPGDDSGHASTENINFAFSLLIGVPAALTSLVYWASFATGRSRLKRCRFVKSLSPTERAAWEETRISKMRMDCAARIAAWRRTRSEFAKAQKWDRMPSVCKEMVKREEQ